MSRIAVLSPELASQIAAGEVVERPASVVKELVENAIDAGATRVDVTIEGGGISAIVVADDGEGMAPDDAERALERHATSKLARFEDLERIRSYGFRGEALPSIASVSRLTLSTRERAAESGVEIVIAPAEGRSVGPIGLAPGTRLEVRDLFYNVPARRKFLRSTGTESGHVTEVVENAALSRPTLTFTLTRDGRLVREFLRAKDREERVRRVSAEEELAACRGERGPLRIEAFLSRPEAARAGAAGLRLFVNDRPVRDRALLVAIAQAYGSVLERGRYPRGVVFLDMAPELVDVNVHPQKSEVRFADPRATSDALYAILSKALTTAFSLPTPERGTWGRRAATASSPSVNVARWGTAGPPSGGVDSREALEPPAPPTQASPGSWPANPPPSEAHTLRDSAAAAPLEPSPGIKWSMLRFVAQLRQTYLFCEGDEGVYLLDQHAAAERVTFTRLRHEYQSRAVASQALLFPAVIDLTPLETEIVEQRATEIAEVGLDVRVRGPESVSIHAVPKLLQRASAERLLRDLLSEVSRGGGRGFSAAVDLALATMACHGSVRAGDPLSATEAKALLQSLDQADFAGHCPHGRPVVTFTSWAELERKVGRR
ncbi:MAG TPA: DNA mismatch repair endonuclease MutL [Polyangiaceae bacterium]|nr:DNA mismatch repair endonuclease MutL [Polyangiaceae bacterium]